MQNLVATAGDLDVRDVCRAAAFCPRDSAAIRSRTWAIERRSSGGSTTTALTTWLSRKMRPAVVPWYAAWIASSTVRTRQTPVGEQVRPQPHRELRRSGRRLQLHVARARHACESPQPPPARPGRAESRFEPNRFTAMPAAYPVMVSSMRSVRNVFTAKLTPGKPSAIPRESGAYRVQNAGLLTPRQCTDLHFELAVVDAEGIGARSARPTHCTTDCTPSMRSRSACHTLADAQRLLLRRPRHRGHVDDVVTFLQRRDELAREEGQQADADGEHEPDDRRPPARDGARPVSAGGHSAA